MTLNANLQPHECTHKFYLHPNMSSYKGKTKFIAKKLANIQPFWHHIASLQSLGWLNLLIFKAMRVLPKPIFNQTWVGTSKGLN